MSLTSRAVDMSVLVVGGRWWLGGRAGHLGRELDRSLHLGPELRRTRQRAKSHRHQGHQNQAGTPGVQYLTRARTAACLLGWLIQICC